MRLKERQLRDSNLYLILDRESLNARNPLIVARKAVKKGVDIIQLRDKVSSAKDIIAYGKGLKKIADSSAALLIINDRVDICKILDADGVHLGRDDTPLKKARSILGMNKIIGISCRNLKEAKRADKGGADYIAIGPIFKSPTKPALKIKRLKLLKEISKKIRIPVVAIGGINKYNVGRVLRCGADIIAVASAILRKKDIESATYSLKKEIMIAKG